MNKKVVSLALASAMVLGSVSMASAAPYDLVHKTNNSAKNYSFLQFMNSNTVFNTVTGDINNYLLTAKDGKLYSATQVDAKIAQNPGMSFEDAVVGLTPVEVDAPVEGELKVVEVSAINGSQLRVKLSKGIDAAEKTNFSIEGMTVVSAELNTDNKKEVTINISGAQLGKQYNLVTTGLKVNGEAQDSMTTSFTMPNVESLYNAKLSISDGRTVVKANGADSVLVTFTLTDTNGVDVKDNNMEVAFSATFGTFAEKRVTVQNGTATALFNSEVLDTDRDSLLTATVVEASDKNLINVKAEKTLLLSPNPEAIEDDEVGATLTDVAAEIADRVILYFNKDVDVSDYVKNGTKAEYDATKLEITVTDNVNNDLTSGVSKTVVGLKAVPGNSKALYAILHESQTLTDNARVKVQVKDKTGKPATDSIKSTVLTDARRPSILGVSRDGLDKVVVTFSEPVKNVNTNATVKDSAEELENWVIDGVRLDGTKWGVTGTKATVGKFDGIKGEDARHIVTIQLGQSSDGKQIYFVPGTHSIQGANIGDWANRTDFPNNVINTQTLDFEVPQDNEAPTATVEVQSPEQYVVTFNKTILEGASNLTTDLELQKYNTTTKAWEKETKQTIAIREVGTTKNKFVVETKEDWTVVYNTLISNKNYYNDSYRLAIPEGKVTNASNGKTNAKIELLLQGAMTTPDLTSPKIDKIEEAKKGLEYTVTMTEPVKFPGGGGSGDTFPTIAETQGVIPTPTAQFIKKDGSKTIDGTVVSAGDAYNKEITVTPSSELEGGVWTLVVRSISDDVGNTAASADKDFTVEKAVVSDNFRVVWAAADSDNDYTNGLTDNVTILEGNKDAVYIKFSQPVRTTGGSASALTTTNYTLNGDPLPQGTQIVSNIKNYDDKDNKVDSITIILPDGTLTKSIESTVITISPFIQNSAEEALSNGGQFKLSYNHESATVTDLDDFKAALKNEAIRSIDASGVDLSAEDVVVNRLVNITFANNVNSVSVNTTEGGTMTITGGTITGNLTVNTPNAEFINASTVSGTTNIVDVVSGTFINEGTLGDVVITDSNGSGFDNTNGTVGKVTINTTGEVTLDGDITNVEVTKAAKLTIKGTVANLNLTADAKGVKVELGTAGAATNVTNNTGETVKVGDTEVEVVVSVDKVALKAEMTKASGLLGTTVGTGVGEVSPEAIIALDSAKQAAASVHDNVDSTQAQVNSATTALKEAIATFESAIVKEVVEADLTAYNTALAAVIEDDYTAASWGIYQGIVNINVVTAASTQAQVNAATEAITAAQADLVAVEADLTAYNTALAQVIEADYTVASWTTYQAVVDANIVTAADTQAVVDAAAAAITAAQADLVEVADLTAYNTALAQVTQGNYTEASWDTYQGVVDANVVTAESTQAEVDAATSAITAAQADLVAI